MTSPKPSLSVSLITLNEERNIVRCLKSIRFIGKVFSKVEVIVVDAQSRDKTASLARSLGAKVHVRAWKGFSDQKNWAIAKCQGDWILSLDADEELTPSLVREIEEKIPSAPREVDGFRVKRRAFFLGKWMRHCGWWPDEQLRLIRRGSGKFNSQPVHEGLEVKGKVLTLVQPMDHYTYDSIHQYLEKMNHYSDLAILDLDRKGKKVRFWRFYGTVVPFITFFRMYVSRHGFLDGWHGLVVCGLSAFHDFAKYAKMWEKEILKRNP